MCWATTYHWTCCGNFNKYKYFEKCDMRGTSFCRIRGLRKRSRGPCPTCRDQQARHFQQDLRIQENLRREAFEAEFGRDKPTSLDPPPPPQATHGLQGLFGGPNLIGGANPEMMLLRPPPNEARARRRRIQASQNAWIADLEAHARQLEVDAAAEEAARHAHPDLPWDRPASNAEQLAMDAAVEEARNPPLPDDDDFRLLYMM